jgi:hypothetical protein
MSVANEVSFFATTSVFDVAVCKVSFFTNGIFSGDFPNLAPNSDSPSQTVII